MYPLHVYLFSTLYSKFASKVHILLNRYVSIFLVATDSQAKGNLYWCLFTCLHTNTRCVRRAEVALGVEAYATYTQADFPSE